MPVVAGALVAGGVIGGFSVFAVDKALAPSPPPDTTQVGAAPNKTVRVIGTPPPNAVAAASSLAPAQPQTHSAPPPQVASAPQPSPQPSLAPQIVPAQQAASAPQAPPSPQVASHDMPAAPAPTPKAWPDALSHAHPAGSPTDMSTAATTPPPQPTPVAAAPAQQATDKQVDSDAPPAKSRHRGAPSSFENANRIPPKSPADRQRVVNVRPAPPDANDDDDAASDDEASVSHARPVYDYYGNRYSSNRARVYGDRPHVIVRQGRPQQPDDADDAPRPRPEPFWGSRNRDDDDD
jgi:hypothetical protein